MFDSLSELRLLAGSALRYRRQILALKQFFATRECTVLLLDDLTATDHDLQMQSIAHGVVLLEQLNPEYGAERRRLRVVKYRGVQFRGGYHDYVIRTRRPRGVPAAGRGRAPAAADPREAAERHRRARRAARRRHRGGHEHADRRRRRAPASRRSPRSSRRPPRARGQRAALFIFDESPDTLLTRCDAAGHRPRARTSTPGRITHAAGRSGRAVAGRVHPRDPARRSRSDGAKIVVIDSLNGYLNAMPEERFLTIQLHELLTYLGQQGVATILIGAHQGLIGAQMTTPVDASYLADAVILLRYFEASGEVRQAISVMKKRGGEHERTHPRVPPRRRAASRVGDAAARVPRRADRRAGLRGPTRGAATSAAT